MPIMPNLRMLFGGRTHEWRCLMLTLCCVVVLFGRTCSYNIEAQKEKVGMASGTEGSKFGYSVGILRDNEYQIIILIGSPNATQKGIVGYGGLHACYRANTHNITCSLLDVNDGINKCVKLRRSDPTRTHCEEKSGLGTTLAINKNYAKYRYTSTTIPKVTVCAPGWKNTYVETKTFQNFMIGMCLKLDGDLKSISCNIDYYNKLGYCWPFWATGTTTAGKGINIYSYAQGGMSAAYSLDGRSEIVGAPGVNNWRGAVHSIQDSWKRELGIQQSKNSVYYGYALAAGNILAHKNLVAVGAPNHYEEEIGHLGRVEIIEGLNSGTVQKKEYVDFGLERKCDGVDIYSISSDEIKNKLGSKFGAVVAMVDITGDRKDEMFVGAPLYSGSSPEEGRVYVYTASESLGGGEALCGPIAILSGSAQTQNRAMATKARFGSAIASLGDLDRNDINDVAIGAPYEDDGAGAVYIYLGIGQCGCKMEDKYAQRIVGKSLDPGIRSFGWSLYGDMDLDSNGYPDFAVGAYVSNKVFVLRARPVVEVTVRMNLTPSPISIDKPAMFCNNNQLCFMTRVMFQFRDIRIDFPGTLQTLDVIWTMNADTIYKQKEGVSRVVFRNNTKSVLSDRLTLDGGFGEVVYKDYYVDVLQYNGKPEPKDAWTIIEITGNIELVPSVNSSFEVLDPILEKDNPTEFNATVQFDKKCESLDTCTSDLQLGVDMFLIGEGTEEKVYPNTTLFVDSAHKLLVSMDVKNLLNSSYRANISGEVTAALKNDYYETDKGAIGASCAKTTDNALTTFNCSADGKLDKNENFKVEAYFDTSRARLIPNKDMDRMKESILIKLFANQANPDVQVDNNAFEITIDVKLKYDIHIQEDEELSDQVRYKFDVESSKYIDLVHKYYITNKGPSFLPMTYINITVPYKADGKEFAVIKQLGTGCNKRGSLPLIQTTTQPPTTSSTGNPIVEPEKQRRKREVDTPRAAASTQKQGQKNITCQEYECLIIECKITNLEKNTQQTINLTIAVSEKFLSTTKKAQDTENVQEIFYATNATVTDPTIWFGGKVVPWDVTVYAEKWTTLLVESNTVVTEVNIWIIIGSVIGAVLLLVIIVAVLWKLGFFKRKQHKEVQKWKQESLYKRRSQAAASVGSRKSQQPPHSLLQESGDSENDLTSGKSS